MASAPAGERRAWATIARTVLTTGPTEWPSTRRGLLECLRSRRRSVADVERGHHATAVAHLANIACQTGRKPGWDGQQERFIDDAEADRLLVREARKPWNLN